MFQVIINNGRNVRDFIANMLKDNVGKEEKYFSHLSLPYFYYFVWEFISMVPTTLPILVTL